MKKKSNHVGVAPTPATKSTGDKAKDEHLTPPDVVVVRATPKAHPGKAHKLS